MKLLKPLLAATLFSASLFISLHADANFTPSDDTKLAVEYTINTGSEKFDKDFFEFTKQPIEETGFFLAFW